MQRLNTIVITASRSEGIAPALDEGRLVLRHHLTRKIASFVGSSVKRETDIPGLTLVRRTVPTAPACLTYEPSLAVIAQGRKRVDLGRTTFIYDESRFLLTSLDLPIVSQVIEASEESPFIGLALKLEMSVVRELLSQEEIQAPGVTR